MSSSFEMHTDRFVAGTIGPAGARVFYLQATSGVDVVSLRLEKQQVAALAEYLAGILADLPTPDALVSSDVDLVEPVIAEWVVGSLAVAYDESEDRVLIVAEELVPEPDDDEADASDVLDTAPSTARFHVTRGQVAHFVQHAVEVVMAGRPACPLCGRPMDPEGHVCPKTNGHHT
jgi:uncharacterized repeat protein (TIGR03847 family)